SNPIDLTPQVERDKIAPAVRHVLDQPEVAGAIAVDVGLDFPEFADALVAAAETTGKPLVAFTADTPDITARFKAAGVPVMPTPPAPRGGPGPGAGGGAGARGGRGGRGVRWGGRERGPRAGRHPRRAGFRRTWREPSIRTVAPCRTTLPAGRSKPMAFDSAET